MSLGCIDYKSTEDQTYVAIWPHFYPEFFHETNQTGDVKS